MRIQIVILGFKGLSKKQKHFNQHCYNLQSTLSKEKRTNSRCPFYKGVRLIVVSVKRESTVFRHALPIPTISPLAYKPLRLKPPPPSSPPKTAYEDL